MAILLNIMKRKIEKTLQRSNPKNVSYMPVGVATYGGLAKFSLANLFISLYNLSFRGKNRKQNYLLFLQK